VSLVLNRLSNCDKFVTFIVGPRTFAKKFLVHKQFACHYSPVLKTAFNGSFVEGLTQTYKLEDTAATAFTLFVQWLYTRKIEEVTKSEHFIGEYFHALTRLWVLADKLLIPCLQNQAIDAIDEWRKAHNMIAVHDFKYAYQNTSDDSPLRRLFVQHCVWNLTSETFKLPEYKFPEEMLRDLCTCFREVVLAKGGIVARNMADFHVKEDKSSS
jgi:hypothetical protein